MSGVMIIPNQNKVSTPDAKPPHKKKVPTQEMNLYEKIKKTGSIFREQGRDAALNFVIKQKSRFFIIFLE